MTDMFDYKLSPINFDPFVGDTIAKVVPSTEPQQEIWTSCLIGGDDANLAFNESISLELNGQIDDTLLKDALRQLIARNESLRSSFSADGKQMIVYMGINLPLEFQDISTFDTLRQDEILRDYHVRDSRRPFDITNGPLIRMAMFRLGDNKYWLTINKHHIISDGWSTGIMLEELSGIYNALLKQQALPALPLQFSDYAVAAYRFSQTAAYGEIENYWVREYQHNIPSFEIPVDFPRPKMRTYKATRLDYTIDRELGARVRKAGATFGCSFVTTLLAAFEVLLHKYSGNTDVVIGLPTAGQSAAEMYNLIGHCVNILPLRSRPQASMAFSDYLKDRKSKTLRDYENQRFTFGSLLKKLSIPRDPSKIPLIPVSFNIDIGMDSKVAFEGFDFAIHYNIRTAETFELFLNISETRNGYEFQWSYNTQLYTAVTIRGLMDKYVYLLEQVIANPRQQIGDLKLENEAALISQVQEWNNTSRPLSNTTVAGLLGKMVEHYADQIAVVFGETQLTYCELDEQVNRLAGYISNQGIAPGDIVPVILDRGPQILITLLALFKCGAAYLPIDPGFPEERIKYMLADAGATWCITNNAYAVKFSLTKSIQLDTESDLIASQSASFPQAPQQPENLAYILYTSGTTGQPKGVLITQKNLVNLLLGVQDVLHTGPHTRLLSVTTISFDIATMEIFLPLIGGGQLHLSDEETVKSGEALLSILERHKINMLQATPITFKMMLDAGWEEKMGLIALCGGEALPYSLAQRLIPKIDALYNMYGPTETTIWSTIAKIEASDEIITIGRPIQNTSVYILGEQQQLLPAGAEGEICIGGVGVALGYHLKNELTRERFINDTFSTTGGRLYRTGDLGRYLADGNIVCLGRTDNQAKIRGYRVELEEVEYHIHPLKEVKDVVVAITGKDEASQQMTAFIIPQQYYGNGFTKDQVLYWRNALKEKLPAYMIPSGWVEVTEFPLTPNKKIDRKALVNSVAVKTKIGTPATEAANETIDTIKKIWEEELGIKGIEPTDDFFELGGHSMIAVQVMNKIEKETGVKLPIATLFETPTIYDLAKKIMAGEKPAYSHKVVIPIKKTGSKTPIFIVHAGGLNVMLYKLIADHLEEDQPLYGLQGLGDDGDLSHLTSIETIASRYLAEIMDNYPQDRYILMGYSFGGIIAFEMAKQLISAGKEVQLVGILDTFVSSHWYKTTLSNKIISKVLRQIRKIGFILNNLGKYPLDTLKYQRLVIGKKLRHLIKSKSDDGILGYSGKIVEAYNNAYYNYEIQPLDVKICLFKVEKRLYFLDDVRFLGWKPYAKNGLMVKTIPGDHKTFMLEPNNSILAKTIQNVVDGL